MLKTKNSPAPRSKADVGPLSPNGHTPLLARHAAVLVEDLPVFGRRARRQLMHERLWKSGAIDEAAYDAVERFVDAYEAAARYGVGSTLGRLDASRGAADPHLAVNAVVDDVAHVGRVKKRLGPMRYWLVVATCCEGRSVAQLAKQFYGAASGGARAQVEEAVKAAILLLAGQEPEK